MSLRFIDLFGGLGGSPRAFTAGYKTSSLLGAETLIYQSPTQIEPFVDRNRVGFGPTLRTNVGRVRGTRRLGTAAVHTSVFHDFEKLR